jgi:hypothetical protein
MDWGLARRFLVRFDPVNPIIECALDFGDELFDCGRIPFNDDFDGPRFEVPYVSDHGKVLCNSMSCVPKSDPLNISVESVPSSFE